MTEPAVQTPSQHSQRAVVEPFGQGSKVADDGLALFDDGPQRAWRRSRTGSPGEVAAVGSVGHQCEVAAANRSNPGSTPAWNRMTRL